jgi:hypothetical protein
MHAVVQSPVLSSSHQGSTAPSANLSASCAISATTSVHVVSEPGLTLENLGADAFVATEPQCALKGGRTLLHMM